MDSQTQTDKLAILTGPPSDEYPDLISQTIETLQTKATEKKRLILTTLEFEIWWAKIYTEAERNLEKQLGRTPTLSAIEYYAITTHETEYRSRKMNIAHMQHRIEDLDGICQALQLRRDYLMSKAADTRAGV